MTMAQKILAAHTGRERVEVGELIDVSVDMVLANDITAPIAINEFARLGVDRVFDQERIALVPDHFAPNKDIKSAEQCKQMREFAHQYGIVALLRGGAHGHRARAAARAGPGAARRSRRGRRFAHLHLRRGGRLCHRHGLHRHRRGHGHRQHLDARPVDDQDRLHGRAAALGGRQGPDPAHHRPDRRGRRALPGDRVHRAGHRRRCPWTAA